MSQPTELIHYLAIGRPDRGLNPQNHEILGYMLTKRGEENAAIYKENAQKILNKAHKLESGRRIRLTSEQDYEIHVMSDSSETATFIFIAITDQEFGVHHNTTSFSDEFKAIILRSIPRSEWGASKGSLIKRIDSALSQILKKYNTSSLLQANQRVDDVKAVMTENVNMALDHVERLEEIDQKSKDLEQSSKEFQDKSAKVRCRMLTQQWKILALVVVVVIVVIVIIAVSLTAGK